VHAPGGVQQDDVKALQLGGLHGPLGDIDGVLALDNGQGRHADLLAQHFKLFHGRRAAGVEGGHQDLFLVLLHQALGQLGRGRGFARALQADHQDRRGRHGIEIDIDGFRTQGLDQGVVDDLDHHLARRHAFDDFLADGAFANHFDEVTGHGQGDVGFQQGLAHFAQGPIDITLAQRAAPGKLVEYRSQTVCQAIEHQPLSSLQMP